MKYLPLIAVLLFPLACGPDWGDCQTCKPGEDHATSVDGSQQIPEDPEIVVIVNVNVNTTTTTTTTTTTVNPPTPPPVIVITTPDAGTPPKTPVCRNVCVCAERRYTCNKHHSHSKSCSHQDKCVKEAKKCS